MFLIPQVDNKIRLFFSTQSLFRYASLFPLSKTVLSLLTLFSNIKVDTRTPDTAIYMSAFWYKEVRDTYVLTTYKERNNSRHKK